MKAKKEILLRELENIFKGYSISEIKHLINTNEEYIYPNGNENTSEPEPKPEMFVPEPILVAKIPKIKAPKDPDTRRNSYLTGKFGITLSDYQEMLSSQNGACAICLKLPTRSLAVDHDHTSGEVRGLLCANCNSGLGFFADSIQSMKNGIAYLEAHPTNPDVIVECRNKPAKRKRGKPNTATQYKLNQLAEARAEKKLATQVKRQAIELAEAERKLRKEQIKTNHLESKRLAKIEKAKVTEKTKQLKKERQDKCRNN